MAVAGAALRGVRDCWRDGGEPGADLAPPRAVGDRQSGIHGLAADGDGRPFLEAGRGVRVGAATRHHSAVRARPGSQGNRP